MPDSNQTRIECGSYFADVLQVTSGTEPFWYYIIQRKGSKGIIDLGSSTLKKKPSQPHEMHW